MVFSSVAQNPTVSGTTPWAVCVLEGRERLATYGERAKDYARTHQPAEHAWPWYSYLIVRIDRGRGADMASWVLDDERPLMHSESLDVLSEV